MNAWKYRLIQILLQNSLNSFKFIRGPDIQYNFLSPFWLFIFISDRRLLEKNERIEGILSALGQNEENQEEIVQELEELITPAEKNQINKLKIDLAR